MTEDRRRVPRYSTHVKATVTLPRETTPVTVMVEDLCVLGCLLEYCPILAVHQECDFCMAWEGRELRTHAVVAWRGEQGQVGLEFQNTGRANLHLLRELCADFQARPLVRLSEDRD